MAKKNKQAVETLEDVPSDPKDDACDAEQARREDERGRTVLAMVGKAIQNNSQIPLEWNKRRVPCGKFKTAFSTYIGVVACERVSINYRKWKDVPKEVLDELYTFITKGFTVREDRKKWVLTQASNRWRAFKTRLRKYWLYKDKEKEKVRKSTPWKYLWILQDSWDKFITTYNTNEFKALSEKNWKKSLEKTTRYRGGRLGYQYYEEELERELLKQGIQVTEVPRHMVWIKAHSQLMDGVVTFKSTVDLEIAELIKSLMTNAQNGGIDSKGRDNILARAMNKPERGGHVVAIGSGITKKGYFGYNKPTPPNQLHEKIDYLTSELGVMKNYQNLLTSFVMSSLNQDQVNQLMALNGSGQFSGSNVQHIGFNVQTGEHISGSSGEQTASQQQYSTTANSSSTSGLGVSFTQLLAGGLGGVGQQNEGVKFSLFSSEPPVHVEVQDQEGLQSDIHAGARKMVQEVEPYFVSWPTTQVQQPLHTQQQLPDPNLLMLDSHTSAHFFPEGESECCLALQGPTGELQVVAIGTVFTPGGGEKDVLNHHSSMQNGLRRVGIHEEFDATALLPCPTEEWTYVCQAKGSFVQWPTHLILPRNKVDKQQKQPPTHPHSHHMHLLQSGML